MIYFAKLVQVAAVTSVFVLGLFPVPSGAEHERRFEIVQKSPIIAQRGSAVVTVSDVDAWLSQMPVEHRPDFLSSTQRLGDAIDQLMLTRLLAERALERGALEDSDLTGLIVQALMVLLAESELERTWLEAKLESYTQQAREYYALNQSEFTSDELVDFTYLNVISEGKSTSEARELANYIRSKVVEGELTFDEAVREYSEAPDLEENFGFFDGVDPEELEPTFRDALNSLQEGEISDPVLTPFGWVLIRLDRRADAGRQLSFVDVQEQLEDQMMRRHRAEVQARLRSRVISDDTLTVDFNSVEVILDQYHVARPEERARMLREAYEQSGGD